MSSGIGTVEPRQTLLRWLLTPCIALAIVLLLVALMRWMIRAPAGAPATHEVLDTVHMVDLDTRKDRQAETDPTPAAAPPPPPPAPAGMARPALPAIAAPAISMTPTPVQISVAGGGSGLNLGAGLGGSGVFGGFANGTGGGGGGGGGGQGQHFAGKDLVPLSTARPQMPDWACKQKIAGWVEVIFTVLPTGRVKDVRIVDAQPRGVYEAAAIESVSNWLYGKSEDTREVEQRVEMDPADCQYNWR